MRTGSAYCKAGMAGEKVSFLRGCRFATGGARDHCDRVRRAQRRERGPCAFELGRHRAGAPPRPLGVHRAKSRQRPGAARCRVPAFFHHQKCADRPGHEPAAKRGPLPDALGFALPERVAHGVVQDDCEVLGIVGATDQSDLALSCADTRMRDPHGVDAGRLLAHEGARGAGDAMHDRDVAGQKVGQLRQEQGRAQVAHQAFVDEHFWLLGLGQTGQDCGIDRFVALGSSGDRDHVHAGEEVGVAFGAGTFECETRGIGANPLQRFHLPLITLLRDLAVEFERGQPVDGVGRVKVGVGSRRRRVEVLPMHLASFAEA